jgi:hypothetical protein
MATFFKIPWLLSSRYHGYFLQDTMATFFKIPWLLFFTLVSTEYNQPWSKTHTRKYMYIYIYIYVLLELLRYQCKLFINACSLSCTLSLEASLTRASAKMDAHATASNVALSGFGQKKFHSIKKKFFTTIYQGRWPTWTAQGAARTHTHT